MTTPTTIIDSVLTNSMPPYTIVRYQDPIGVPANSDSTSLIELELPALNTLSTRTSILLNKSYVIDLSSISISCSSTDFDVRILNKNDISLIYTNFEVYNSTSNNLSYLDSFSKFIIINRDTVLDNKLYLYISNNSGIDTGPIDIELIYVTLQDRLF